MNKKIFTLLAVSLMLFSTVFAVNAQLRPTIGSPVKSLPSGTGTGVYHLQVTSIGDGTNPSDSTYVLALDEYDNLKLVRHDAINAYQSLRQALWCVNVSERGIDGLRPGFTFINKASLSTLSVTDDWWRKGNIAPTPADPASYSVHAYSLMNRPPDLDTIAVQQYWHGTSAQIPYPTSVLVGGPNEVWAYSPTHDPTLAEDLYLRISLGNDYYLTFASPDKSSPQIELVKVHLTDFYPGSKFYQEHLLRFTITNAAPRILSALDFNTTLGEKSEDYVHLTSTPSDIGGTNVFAGFLQAEEADVDGDYLTLKNKADGKFVTVLDGSDADDLTNYNNYLGRHYPKLGFTDAINEDGESAFRFVYYPSEDSLVTNVYRIDHIDDGVWAADDAYLTNSFALGADSIFTWNIWNHLTVRLQDLNVAKPVLTVATKPANLKLSFGVLNCKDAVDGRTTIEPDLYTIKDADGRYLIIPLYVGDFTPKWEYLDVETQEVKAKEVALKTPAYQWLVTKVEADSKYSKIHLTNREFDYIRLEYVQIYDTDHPFNAVWQFIDPVHGGVVDYGRLLGNNVSDKSFTKVNDRDDVAAKLKAGLPLTVEEELHRYRTGPHLGYKFIAQDTLNYFGYAFHYLNYNTIGHPENEQFYFGVTAATNKTSKDTTLYVAQERTFFELQLPDNLAAPGGVPEKYGISATVYAQHDNTKDIAPLERYYYYFKINDYYKYVYNNNFLVLDDNARYAYTPEANANARKLHKAKFYLRFTYESENTEYYTLLDRIDVSDFHYLTDITGLSISDTLRSNFDNSHGLNDEAFGVVQASVVPGNLYVRGQVKTLGANRVSTFSLTQTYEPLYRRFNTEAEGNHPGDAPEVLRFYRANSAGYTGSKDYLYEDQHSVASYDVAGTGTSAYGNGINFLGYKNYAIDQEDGKDDPSHVNPHSFAFFVDTAYVNRGTGWIKPQYMLAVGDTTLKAGYNGCYDCVESPIPTYYRYARYLWNASDSARANGKPAPDPIRVPNGGQYLWNSTWERLIFVNAIHVEDTLYVLNERTSTDPRTGKVTDPIDQYFSQYKTGDVERTGYLNYELLRAEVKTKKVRPYYLGNNKHKDCVFSFRFVERQNVTNASNRFYIESETTKRDTTTGRIIAPMNGGWIKLQNGVPVISRGSYEDWIADAEEWNVEPASEKPVANEAIAASEVTVVSGTGAVTILNASGKKAVISNILGQTVANTILTSDNETIAAPTGVVVVAIEGENAVKTVVK
jgi:hypothetical protein